MTKQQMMRKRLCGAFYVLVTLLTVGALALAACGKGGAAYRLFFSEPDALLAFFSSAVRGGIPVLALLRTPQGKEA